MVKVTFKNSPPVYPSRLYFEDLARNESFMIDTIGSKGAVYIKVEKARGDREFYMQEIATGYLFKPTSSPVKRVNVETKVDSYSYTPGIPF